MRRNLRSNSRPGYNQRGNSRPGSNVRPGSSVRPGGNNARPGSKSQERPKWELPKKVEMIEKKYEKKFKKEIKEMLKNKLIETQFVEEEIIIDVKYVNKGTERMMLIDIHSRKNIRDLM